MLPGALELSNCEEAPEKAGEIISSNHLPECFTDLSEVLEEVSGERAV